MFILKAIFLNSKCLFHLEAKCYAYIYLILIPLFGIIYFFNVDNFYQSSNFSEHGSENVIVSKIDKGINQAISNNKRKDIEKIVFEKCLPTEYVKIISESEFLKESLEKLEFQILISHPYESKITKDGNYQFIFRINTFNPLIELMLSELDSRMTPKDKKVIDKITKILEQLGKENTGTMGLSSIIRIKLNNTSLIQNNNCNLKTEDIFDIHEFKIEHHLHTAIRKPLYSYYEFINGRPTSHGSIISNFIKMIYFSTVTITTLGYGDIVPVTDMTRILVSIESILGVILIGLFLNALARKL